MNKDDHTRFQALDRLEEPLKNCQEASEVVGEKLKKAGSLRDTNMGASFDDKLNKSLKVLEESRKVFEIALHADQE